MAEADFFRDAAKQSTARSVKKLEGQTSAEVVVAVRRRSGDYRVTTYHFGFCLAALVVLYLLLAPQLFSVAEIALDAGLGFGMGVLLAANVGVLLRALVRKRVLSQNVDQAARVAFFELGISRTSARTGVLIFVSTFEQRVAVLADIGIDVAALGSGWREGCGALASAVKRRDLAAFERALEGLGPILGAVLPRSNSDVNELPDEVR